MSFESRRYIYPAKGVRSQRPRARLLSILAPLLLLALAAVGFATMRNYANLNASIAPLIRRELSSRLMDDSNLLYSIGNLQVWDTAIVLLVITLWLSGRKAEAAIFLMGLTVDFAVMLMKALEAPFGISGSLLAELWAALDTGRFPSGHVARTTVSLGLLLAMFPATWNWWKLPAAVVAGGFMLMMGVVSITSGGHRIGDVLGAYLLAALWVDLLLLAKALAARRQRPTSVVYLRSTKEGGAENQPQGR